MKILLVSPIAPPVGGIARWSDIILEAYKKNNNYCIFHINNAPKYHGNPILFKRILFGFLSIISVCFKSLIKFKKGIDILHITTSGSLAIFRDLVLLKLAKHYHISTVLHIHYGKIPSVYQNNGVLWKIFLKVFSLCDAIISIDFETKQTIDKNGFAEISYFCPNPIDVSALNKNITQVEKNNTIVYLGQIYKDKGIAELTEAWLEISSDFPEFKLKIIGFPLNQKFADSLAKSDSIIYTGEKKHNEAMQLLSEATALILPSYSEGFPNVILEAMALHIPVIATNVGAIPKMIADENGILIEPKSVESLKNAIYKMLTETEFRKKCADNAYLRVVNNYDLPVVLLKYEEIWNKILS